MTASYDGHTYVVGKCVALSDKPMDVAHTTEGLISIKTEGNLTITGLGKPKLKHYTIIAETGVVGDE
jgi:hypothetical protein